MRILGFLRLRTARRALVSQNYCRRYCHDFILKVGVGVSHGFGDIFPASSEAEAKTALKTKQCVYAGFDPTADSLHIGHLMVLVNLLQWHRAGHQVIIVLGGATGMIGDPTDRNSERVPMQNEIIQNNICKIRENIETIFSNYAKYYSKDQKLLPPIVLNNFDWYKDETAISFMRNVGKQCRMGTMLLRSSVQSRLKSGTMSLKEFTYQLFQAYDWLHLLRRYDCRFQVGGADQMGNIVAGHDLISRMEGKKSVYGLTMPLLLGDESTKMGKSGPKPVWLSPDKTYSVELHAYITKLQEFPTDALLKLFTVLDVEEIEEITREDKSLAHCGYARLKVADFVTRLCHGEKGIEDVRKSGEHCTSPNYQTMARVTAEDLAKSNDDSRSS